MNQPPKTNWETQRNNAIACGWQERGGGPEGIYWTHEGINGGFIFEISEDSWLPRIIPMQVKYPQSEE